MLNRVESEKSQAVEESVSSLISRVCGYIPPLWDLSNYVAVNPFLGFSGRQLSHAAKVVTDGLGAQVLPSVAFYQKRWKEGAFDAAALEGAAGRLSLDSGALKDILDGTVPPASRRKERVLSFAERFDRESGTDWTGAIIRSMTRWCAVYASGGSDSWPFPEGQGLFATWREAESVDRTLEIAGLKGWRQWIRQLPTAPAIATEQVLNTLKLTPGERESYLYHLLGGVYGWASFFKRSSWQATNGDLGLVAELLAIRVCGDAAVAELASRNPNRQPISLPTNIEDEQTRYALQEALEDGYVTGLLQAISPPRIEQSLAQSPSVQAVFCIDVRSEVLRRHLEAQSDKIQTKGFAGFFGVTLEWQTGGQSSARCPVLLKPAVRLCAADTAGSSTGPVPLKYLQTAPAASFSFVELLGAFYGLGLAKDALSVSADRTNSEGSNSFSFERDGTGSGIDLQSRVDLACGILTNMGLRSGFAQLVLLCGHEGHSTNNPHAAGLDCGACGGHGGSINARVAAAILNDPAVRDGLRTKQINIPSGTFFLAGVHDTSIDEVTLHDVVQMPQGHAELAERLREWLSSAGEATRNERARAMGLSSIPSEKLSGRLERRARDWSEVRPEWGLARNAAFIAARRERTRGVNLAGRSFLHDYDCAADADSSILTLILTAPMIVASWINLQYFGSTVDNSVFGCGDKALHNRVGTLGVVLGNGGDLRTGLPKQSVHAPDGSWFHEPLRLQVVVEAETRQIDRVLSVQKGVRELLDNGWLRMFALHPLHNEVHRRLTGGTWEVCNFTERQMAEACTNPFDTPIPHDQSSSTEQKKREGYF